MSINISEILSYLSSAMQAEVYNDNKNLHEQALVGFSTHDKSSENTIVWSNSIDLDIESIKAPLLIINDEIKIPEASNLIVAVVNDPRLAFAKISEKFFKNSPDPIIHKTAFIHESCDLGKGVSIGPYCVVGENTKIGEGTILQNHVTVYRDVEIGTNCVLKSCAVVGEEGFGVARDDDEALVKMHHSGTVIIGDNVELGSNSTTCRGTINNTIIEDGVKSDDHVHLAHNCHIGRNVAITAGVVVCGSVKIQENCWLGVNSSILEGVNLAKNTTVGIGCVVLRDTEPDSVYVGNPGKRIK